MKKLLCVSVLAGLGVLCARPVWAIRIDFAPSDQVVQVGDALTVDLVISGLTAAGEIVSAFDLDVIYDNFILSATGVTFGLELGDPSLPFEAQTSYDIATPGLVDLRELSLFSDDELAAQQGDDVFLATLSFAALSPGRSSLGFLFDDVFNFNYVTGFYGLNLDIDAGSGSVTAVPEPSTLFLLCSGLATVAVRRWTRRRSSILI